MSDFNSFIAVHRTWAGGSKAKPLDLIWKSCSSLRSIGVGLMPLYLMLIALLAFRLYVFENISFDVHYLITAFGQLLFFYLVFACLIQLAVEITIKPCGAVRRGFSLYFKKFFSVFFASFLTALMIVLGSFVIFPSLYAIVVTLLYIPLILFLDQGPIQCLKKSFALIKNHWFLGLKVVGFPFVLLILLVGFLLKTSISHDLLVVFISFCYPIAIIFFIFVYLNLYVAIYLEGNG